MVSDDAFCDHCKKAGRRRRGTMAPAGWFYLEAVDTSAVEDGVSVDDATTVVWACSTECRDAQWKTGPGKLEKACGKEAEERIGTELRAITNDDRRRVVERILCAWKQRPWERLGQFLANARRLREDGYFGESDDGFNIEDFEMVEACERYIAFMNDLPGALDDAAKVKDTDAPSHPMPDRFAPMSNADRTTPAETPSALLETTPAPPEAPTNDAAPPALALAEDAPLDAPPSTTPAADAAPTPVSPAPVAAPTSTPVPAPRLPVPPDVALMNPPPRPVARSAADYRAAGWEPNAAAAKAAQDAKLLADYELQFGPPEPVATPITAVAAEAPTASTTLIAPAFAQKGDVVKMIDGLGIEAPQPFYVVSQPMVDHARGLVRADLAAEKDGPAILHAILLNANQARFPTSADVAPLPDAAPAATPPASPAINAPGSTVIPPLAKMVNESIGDYAKRTLQALSSGATGQVAPNTPGAATPALPQAAPAQAATVGATAPAVLVHGRTGPVPPTAQPIAPMVTVPGGVKAANYCHPYCEEPWPHVHGKCPPACRDNHSHVTYDRKNPEPTAEQFAAGAAKAN